MTGGTIQSGKLAGRTLPSAILVLAVPVFVQQLMQAFVGMADKVFAGRLPEEIRVAGLDAIGIGSYIGWFIGIAMAGLGIGGQALIARAMGAGDRPLAQRALGQAIGLSAVWGAVVGVVLWAIAPSLATMCGLSDVATDLYVQYMSILALSMPAAGVMMVGAMCLHGAGETTLPSTIAVAVNIVNILASWILSGVDIDFGGAWFIANPFDFDWHVRGIAAGTALAYLCGALLTLRALRRGVKDLDLDLHELRPRADILRRMVRIGIPNFMEGISMWTVNLFILGLIGMIAARQFAGGEGLQGAHIIAVQWEAFSFLPGFAIGTAAGALAGQYLGAGNPHMARRAIIACTVIGWVGMGLLGIVFIFCGEPLTRLVSSEPVHVETVPELLRICGYVQIFFATTMIVRQGLRGVGDTRWTFIITTVSSYGVRLPAAWYLGVHLELGLPGIWYALCGEFCVRAALFASRFLHGGWTKVRV